jgi:hypothetical protein
MTSLRRQRRYENAAACRQGRLRQSAIGVAQLPPYPFAFSNDEVRAPSHRTPELAIVNWRQLFAIAISSQVAPPENACRQRKLKGSNRPASATPRAYRSRTADGDICSEARKLVVMWLCEA